MLHLCVCGPVAEVRIILLLIFINMSDCGIHNVNVSHHHHVDIS
jgi:hypothetical protein